MKYFFILFSGKKKHLTKIKKTMEPVTKKRKIELKANIEIIDLSHDESLETIDLSHDECFRLEDLPNEIILKIFGQVKNIKDLIRCSQVSNRVRAIAHDNPLWEAMHLRSVKGVPAKLLKMILENGCKYFSFPYVKEIKGTVQFNQNVKLKYLYFTYRSNADDVLLDLAASCFGLEKLAISGLMDINPKGFAKILKCVKQNSSTMKVLSIIACKIPDKVLELIVTLCVELQGISY